MTYLPFSIYQMFDTVDDDSEDTQLLLG